MKKYLTLKDLLYIIMLNFYKFRTGSRSLMLGSGGIGGSITLNREALN